MPQSESRTERSSLIGERDAIEWNWYRTTYALAIGALGPILTFDPTVLGGSLVAGLLLAPMLSLVAWEIEDQWSLSRGGVSFIVTFFLVLGIAREVKLASLAGLLAFVAAALPWRRWWFLLPATLLLLTALGTLTLRFAWFAPAALIGAAAALWTFSAWISAGLPSWQRREAHLRKTYGVRRRTTREPARTPSP